MSSSSSTRRRKRKKKGAYWSILEAKQECGRRYGHTSSLVYADGGLKMLVMGGCDQNGVFSSRLFRFDVSTKTWTSSGGELIDNDSSGNGHAKNRSSDRDSDSFNEKDDNNDDENDDNDLAKFRPVGRHFHTAVLRRDAACDGIPLLYVFGGKSNGYLSDLNVYDAEMCRWTSLVAGVSSFNAFLSQKQQQQNAGSGSVAPNKSDDGGGNDAEAPSGRYGHSAVLYRDAMIVFGGYDQHGFCCEDVHCFRFGAHDHLICRRRSPPGRRRVGRWSAWKTDSAALGNAGVVLERYHHSAVAYESSMYVFGGKNSVGMCKPRLVELHFETRKWATLDTVGSAPGARWGHAAAVSRDKLFLFGGTDGQANFADLYCYAFGARTWQLIQVSLCPSARHFSTLSALDDGKDTLYVFGGKNLLNHVMNDVHAFRLKCRAVDSDSASSSVAAASSSSSAAIDSAASVYDVVSSPVSSSPSSSTLSRRKPRRSRKSKQSSSASATATREFRLKCHFGDEIRIIPVHTDIRFERLLELLAQQYNVDVPQFQYRDEDGDLITVRSQSDLDMLVAQLPTLMSAATSTLKVFLSQSSASTPTTPLSPRHQQHYAYGSDASSVPSSSATASTATTASTLSSLRHSNGGDSLEAAASLTSPRDTITWEKGQILGRGAFGVVYLGMTQSGELLAVKQVQLLGVNEHKEQQAVASLRREIRLMQHLDHPNIVRYLGSQQVDHSLNIFLEYVPGGSLRGLLRRFMRFTEPVLRSFTRQILDGLAYLHDHGIVHRDIKGASMLTGEKEAMFAREA
jgi:Protein kinase domain/PB1 domain/Galactose oxidase, central domain